MRDPKARLLRAFGDLVRSKVLYDQLTNASGDPELQSWFIQVEQRIAEDVQ
jgi:hypothetical protein